MANKIRRIIVALILSFTLGTSLHAQFYNGMRQPFGKNRIQYEQFDWMKYEFDYFTVFFYGEGKNLAIYTARNAGDMVEEMEQFFDYSLRSERLQIVVYQKLEHFRQSNVGIPDDDDSNIGGKTQIVGSKIFVYYPGDLNEFRTQIRRGIAEVLVGQMLFGDNWREMIKNNALISFPQWFTKGLTNYAAQPWDVDIDDDLRDLISRGKYSNFNRLKGSDVEIAGQSVWHYIAETYGSNVIPNILYMSRVTRSIESGFLFVLGISMKTLMKDAREYFEFRYETDEFGAQEFEDFDPIRTKKSAEYSEPKVSNDGRYLSYVSNQMSKTKVFIYDYQKGRRKRYLRQGHKLDHIYDQSYPIMDWNPVTGELFVITEKKGNLMMTRIDPEKGKISKIELLRLEKVMEMDFSSDGKQILFAAINNGQSDIYLYSIAANSQKQLTNDIYDDRYPVFWKENSILFASNRANDTVNLAKDYLEYAPLETKDIFQLNLDDDEVAFNLTNTPQSDEKAPAAFNDNRYMYLGDESGIRNRYIGQIDSSILSIDTAITYRYFSKNEPLTAYFRNLKEYDYNRKEKKLSELFFFDGRFRFLTKEGNSVVENYMPGKSNFVQDKFAEDIDEEELNTPIDTMGITIVKKKVFPESIPGKLSDDGAIDIFNYQFDSESIQEAGNQGVLPSTKQQNLDTISASKKTRKLKIPEMRNYNLAFAATDLTTQFDFDYVTDLYQPFNGGPYVRPGLGTFVKVGMLDVFEDYKVEGGFRYSFNGSGTEYFISLENRSKRWDKKYILQRQSLVMSESVQITQRNQMYLGKGIFRYPFDEVQAMQFTTLGRYDRLITLGSDGQRLEQSDVTDFMLGAKAEYIYDNTMTKGLNILTGSRAKVFGEYYRSAIDPSTSLSVIGVDARNYTPIHRELIWANRVAGSSSFGPNKLIYYMGSVDDWIVLGNRERFDRSTEISQTQGYRFQTIATNMRGFIQNARNGNNFVVLNSELRWPIIRYFTNKPIKSEFLSSFQVIGFGDLGTAWTGVSPYSEENTFNKITVTNSSITVIYENQTDPFIGSLGWGMRAKIWGYFVRFDYAYGIENGLFLEPVTHLSLGLDF
ncbi:MAG TPA: hypothetical protein DCR48_15245 [Flavobacteriales bacterium]|nr:hypothetical protein [Flavobacteriales bacterium]